MKHALCALLGAAALAVPAAHAAQPAPPATARATPAPSSGCFRTRDIDNHTIGDERTLYIRVLNRDVYRVAMAGSCLAGAMPTDPLVMREPPGMNLVCKPIDMDVSISKGGFRTPCIVDSITKLTPAEVKALPKKLQP
jgi:hypothetical protein